MLTLFPGKPFSWTIFLLAVSYCAIWASPYLDNPSAREFFQAQQKLAYGASPVTRAQEQFQLAVLAQFWKPVFEEPVEVFVDFESDNHLSSRYQQRPLSIFNPPPRNTDGAAEPACF